MKIVHILDHSLPLHSGYTFRSQSIFRAQAKHGWHLSVLTSPKHQESWKGSWNLQESIGGFPYHRTPSSQHLRLPFFYEMRLIAALEQRLSEVVATTRPNIIHAHSPVLNAIAALRVARKTRIPFVYEIRAFWEDAAVDHGSYGENSWKYRLVRAMETWACKRADHIFVICAGLRKDLVQRGIRSKKISIIPNGIDAEEFPDCEPDSEFLTQWKLCGKRVIAFLGSFYRYEGLDLAVDAFAQLAPKHKDWRLLLVGGGEMEASLKNKVRTLELGDRVLFPGRVPHDRIQGIYALSDILVYPRYPMRLTDLVTPLKPLEAMAMKKAVIASNVGGHQELIRHGVTGELFPAGNAAALALAIERMLANDASRQATVERAWNWVRNERSWDKTTSAYADVYTRLIRGSALPSQSTETTLRNDPSTDGT